MQNSVQRLHGDGYSRLASTPRADAHKCASGYAWNKHTARVPPPLPPHPVSIGPKVAVAYEEGKKT